MNQSYNVEEDNTPSPAAGFSAHNTTDAVCIEDFCGKNTSNPSKYTTCDIKDIKYNYNTISKRLQVMDCSLKGPENKVSQSAPYFEQLGDTNKDFLPNFEQFPNLNSHYWVFGDEYNVIKKYFYFFRSSKSVLGVFGERYRTRCLALFLLRVVFYMN